MATNAIETKKQENGSKVYFEAIIEKNVKDYASLLQIVKKVYPDVSPEWMSTYEKQAIALKKYLGSSRKGYIYSRDESSGFMNFIDGTAMTNCGVRVKDSWNPADIYMVKKINEKKIRDKIKDITSSSDKMTNLLALNSYMRELVDSKEIVPISLKAILAKTKEAKAELSNMGVKHTSEHEFRVKDRSIKCILSMGHKQPHEFDTGEFAFDFFVGQNEIHGQSRNFQYSKARNLIQTDLTPKGRDAGAKLGKVSASSMDNFLNKIQLPRPSSAAKDPNIDPVGKWTQKNIEYWINYQKSLSKYKIDGNLIDFGDMTVKEGNVEKKGIEEIIKHAVASENQTRSAAGRFSSKLIGLRWSYTWVMIDQKGKLDDWLKILYYGAKKEFGDTNGPFLKIY